MPATINRIKIYTDGSCHTQKLVGGWAAIIFINDEKTILSGTAVNTTHNRMELTAVIEAIKYVHTKYSNETEVHLYSDSQYVIGLRARGQKLLANNFITQKGNEIQNADLVKEFLSIIAAVNIQLLKIKAHQKQHDEPNYNIEADKLSRKIVRDAVQRLT